MTVNQAKNLKQYDRIRRSDGGVIWVVIELVDDGIRVRDSAKPSFKKVIKWKEVKYFDIVN